MDINVNVTIGLAQHVQDLAQALIETITSRPTELPARSTVSNETPTVAETRAPKIVSKPQPKQEVEQAEHGAEPAQEQPQEQPDVVSIEQVREKVAEAVTQGKRAQVVAILQEFGATGFSQLKGEELNEFYKKIKEL